MAQLTELRKYGGKEEERCVEALIFFILILGLKELMHVNFDK